MSNLVTCVLSKKNLNHAVDNEVFASFTFNPPVADLTKRPPLDISVAMDISGSMSGDKIIAAKASLMKLVEHMTDTDTLSIVTFQNHVEVVWPTSKMTPEAKVSASKVVSEIHSGGGTNLSGGLLQSLTLLKEHKVSKDTVRRCMLFTDGQANEGIRLKPEIVAAVKENRANIPISCFGFGGDHDPELLNLLAMDGGFYYISQTDKILTAFGAELGGLIATFAQTVELKVEPSADVEIAEILNDLTVTADGKAGTIRCDDLLSGQPYTVVMKLNISKRDNAFPRGVAILQAKVKFFNVVEKKPSEETFSVKAMFVKPGSEDTEHDKNVMNGVAYQKSVKAQGQALLMAQKGNFVDARAALENAAVFCRNLGTPEGAKLGAVNMGLINEAYKDKNMYTRGGHHLGSSTRRAMSRGRDFGGLEVGGVNLDAQYGSEAQSLMSEDFSKAGKKSAPEASDLLKHINSVAKKVEPTVDPSSTGVSPKPNFTKSRSRS